MALSNMETENCKQAHTGTNADMQCPICGADARVWHRQTRGVENIFARIYHLFYNTRLCNGCNFSFSSSKLTEYLRVYYLPVYDGLFPGKNAHTRRGNRSMPREPLTAITPSRPARERTKVQAPAWPAHNPGPFLIDPVTRMLSINLQCPLGEGEFGDRVLAAASSLEEHLRSAADQIRLLVDSAEGAPPPPKQSPEVVSSLKDFIDQLVELKSTEPGEPTSKTEN